jgi:hypothetical protein
MGNIVPFYVRKLPGHLEIGDVIYKRCWYPKRCGYTGKFLMFRKPYRISSHAYDFQDYQIVYTWIDRDAYITMKLKEQI